MKYIKTFEKFEDSQFGPQVDDYVLIRTVAADDNVKKFINNAIGKITHIQDTKNLLDKNIIGMVSVQYENIPKNIQSWFGKGSNIRQFMKDQIVAFGKTEEEVKQKVQSNKFNI